MEYKDQRSSTCGKLDIGTTQLNPSGTSLNSFSISSNSYQHCQLDKSETCPLLLDPAVSNPMELTRVVERLEQLVVGVQGFSAPIMGMMVTH